MKLRVPHFLQQFFFGPGCALLLVSQAIAQAPAAGGAQVTFKIKGSTSGMQQGTLLGASAAGVKLQIGTQTIVLGPSMFESFQMTPPPEYAQGYQAYTAGELPKALTLIRSVTDRYKGLPTDWAQYACGMLGDILVATGDFTAAETAYNDFKKLYSAGGSSATTEVGLARIAVAKKDLATAKGKLEPILAEALKEKTVPPNKALAYSQAFLVSGQLKEEEGNLPGALEDYLRTVTIFYHDRAAANTAQQKADALRTRDKDRPVIVP